MESDRLCNMESETSIAEDASATSLPFVESIMRTESEEIKFPQKNGNDQNFKHLLTEETRLADRGNTGEVSEPRQQEIYQESSKACAESEKKAEHQPEGLAMMKIIPKSSVSEDEAEETLPSTASVSDEVVEKSIQQEIHDKEELIMTNVNEEQKPEIQLDEKKEVPEVFGLQESAYQNSDEKESKAEPQLEAQNKEIIYTNQANLEGDEPDKINRCNDTDEEKVQISHSGEKIVPEDDGKIKQEEATEIEEETKMQILKTESESVPEDEAQETLPSTASVSGETVEKSIHQEIQDEGELAETNTNEGHKPEIHLDDKKEVPEESTYQTSEEKEMKAEPQSEAQNQETTFTMKPKIQGNATDTNNKSNDTEENKVPDSHSREKFISEDEGKFKQEEATETEEATKKQILKTESESVPKDEAQDTLPSTASVSDETVETSSHEEIHGEKEIADTNTDEDQLNEIDLDEKRVIFQVFCQHESAYKTSEEKKLKAESQLEVQNQETIQTNQPNSEGNAPETINRSNDIDEENFPISHSRENIEPEDEGRFKQEEATETEDANEIESVPKDEAQDTLPSTASVSDETVQTSNHEEIHDEMELADTNTTEGQIHEIDLDEKKEVSEVFGKHELTYQTSEQKELKSETQLEVQNQETIQTNQENSEGNAPDKINQSNDIEEENVPVSHSGENIEPEDEGTFKQEEATETEDATKIESVPKDEVQDTLPSTASVSDETVETSKHEETHDEEELADIDTNEGKKHEIDLDEKKEGFEVIGQQESAYQPSEEKELKAEPQLEVQNQETILTNQKNSEGKAPKTINQSNDIEEENVPVSHSGENIEPEDDGKFKQEEATETEDATKIESVPKHEAKETLPSTASVSDEIVETSKHEETHDEKELADTDTNEGQKHEIDLDEKREVSEVFGQQESAYQTNEEKELKAEPQLEVQNKETILTNQDNSEGNAPETINQSNDIEEGNVPVSHSGEHIEPEDDGKFKQEEATETGDATKIESVPKDKVKETLPSTASVGDETVETSKHEETHGEKELGDTDTNEGQKHEIDLDDQKEVSEVFGQQESAYQPSEKKELKAEPQLEVQNQETILTNQENSEGNAPETIKQSNDIEEENVPVSHSGENTEPEDDGKFKQEEATETGDATKIESVPKGEAKETLHSTTSFSDEIVETSKHEETHDEKELADTDTNEGQKHEIDLDDKKEVSEVFAQQESAYQTSEEKELKAEPQLEVQNKQTILTNQENSEGNAQETINQSNDIEEGNVPVSHSGENIEPEDDGKFKQEEATETGDATKIESVPKGEAKETLRNTASVSDEIVETSKHEETHDEKELADTDTNEGQKHEIDLDEKKEVSEVFGQQESAYQTSEEKELKAEPQLEVQNEETILTNQENSEGNAQETINQSNDIEEGNVPVSHSGENIEPEDDGKFKQEEATETGDATKIESVPKDEAKEILPSTASVSDETVETSKHEETHDEKELADTDTNEGQKHDIDLDDKKEVSEESAYQTSEEKELKANPQLEVQNKETILTNQVNSEGNAPVTINQTNHIEEGNVPVSHSGENIEPEDDGKFKQEEATETGDGTKLESVPKDEAKQTLPSTASVRDETVETSKHEETHDEKELADTDTNEGQKHEIDLDDKKEVSEVFAQQESAYQTSEEKELKAEPQLEVQNKETILTNQVNSEGNAPETINQSNDIEEGNVPVSHRGENIEPEHDGKFKQEEATETEDASKIESVPEDEAKETLLSTASVSDETVETSKHEETHDEKELADTDTNEGQKHEIDLDDKKEVSEVFGQQESAYQTSEEKELKAEPQLEVQNKETILTNQENSEGNAQETINQSNDIEEGNVPVSHSGENIEPEDDGKFKQEEATETGDATKIESVPKDEAKETLRSTASVSDETVETSKHEETHDEKELADTETNEGQKHEIDLDDKKEVSEESAYQTSEEKELKAEPQLEVQNKETILTNQVNSEGNAPVTINQSNDIEEGNVPVSHSGKNIEPEDDGKFKQQEATETGDGTKIESVPKDEAKETLPTTASVSDETVETSKHEETHDEKELADTDTNEGQKHEIDLDDKKEVSEVYAQQESAYQTSEEKELKAEPQLEVQNRETILTNKVNSEANAPETINQSNDIEEGNVPVSHSIENIEPEDDGKFKQEEATEKEDPTKIESVPKDEAKETLPSTASVSGEIVEISKHEETHDEKELQDTDTNEGQKQEIDHDEKKEVSEVFGQQKSAYQTSEEKELKAEAQLEVQNQETILTNQENSEGNAQETINQSNDIEEGNVPVSHSGENIEPEDDGKFKQEEATETGDATKIENVPKDEDKETLPSTASVSDETVETSRHEETHDEKELADTDTNESQKHEIGLDDKTEVSEVFAQQESAYQTSEEKELKAEPQMEVQNKETILTNQENSEGNAPEIINQSNDVEEGNVPVSHSGENIEPEDDGKFKQEEATETVDATKIESVPKDEAKETLPSTASVSNETVETSRHEETHDEKELADTDTNESQKHEIGLDNKTEVSEESAYQTSEEKELKAEPQLEVQNEETILTNQENSEGNASKIINQSNYIEEGNVPVSHSGENIEPEDDGKFKEDEATETEDATKIESVHKDEAQDTLPSTASVCDETFETSKQEETHDEEELADTKTNESQKHEIDLDEKKEGFEVFGQQESAYQPSEENDLKAEPQLEVQNQETILTNQEISEGNAPETINQSNDIEEENVPVSHSGENIEPEDDGKFKQVEATEKGDATKIESTGVPKDEAKETLPSTASVSGEIVEISKHEETHDEKELQDTDTNEGQKQEIDHDEKKEVSEVFGQQKSAYQTSEEKELKAEAQLEVQNQETILTNQENSEGNAPETINQSNDIKEENVPVSHDIENIEPEDDGKFKQEEATETGDATKIENVPKDEAKETLPSTASVSDETVETSKYEETHDEKELADTDINEGQKHEIDLDDKKELSEVYGQQESAYQTSEEKELKAEPQLEVQNKETILTSQENSEGNAPETKNKSNDIEEGNIPVSHCGENIEPEDVGKFKQEEATETEDATKIESVPKDEAQDTLPGTASVSDETVETSKQEEIHDEEELAVTDTNEGQKHEIDLDEKTEGFEVFGQQESAYQTSVENELKAEPKLEVQNQETILTNQENSEGNAQETINQSNDIEEENVLVSHSGGNIELEDDEKFKQEEATETEDATKIESVHKDEAKDTLPCTASVGNETVETSNHEEIHDEKEFTETTTNEGPILEIDLDEKKEVSEVFDEHETAYQTSEENEEKVLKAKPHLEVQNQETILKNHANAEGNAPETVNQSNDNNLVSHSRENIEPEDDGKFKQEEATETEDATKIESVPKDEAKDTLLCTTSAGNETVETSNHEEIHDEKDLAETNTNEGQIQEIDLDEKKEVSEVFAQQESAYQKSEEKEEIELKVEPQLEVQNQETILTNRGNSEGNAPETLNQSSDTKEENVPVSHSGENIEPEDEGKFNQEEATETEDATQRQSVPKDEAIPRTASVRNETVETSNHEEIHDEKELADTNTNEGQIHETDLDEKKEVSEESTYQTNEEKELKAERQLEVQNQETILTNKENSEGNAPEKINQSNDNEEENVPVSHSGENIEPEDERKFKQEEATETEEATEIESVPKDEAIPRTASVRNETDETSNHEEIHDEKELADTNTNEGQIHETDLDEKKEVSEESTYQTSEEKELKAERQLEVQNKETIPTNKENSEGNAPEKINQSNDIEEENVPVSHSGENIEPEDEGKFKQEEATETEEASEIESVPKDEAQDTLPSTASVSDETVETSKHEQTHDEEELADTDTNEGQKHEIDLDEKKEGFEVSVQQQSAYQTSDEKELKAEPQLDVQKQETIQTNQPNLEGNAPHTINQSNDIEEENVPVSHSGVNIVPEDEGKFKQEEATKTEDATKMQKDEDQETLHSTASVSDETVEKSIHQEIHDEEELAETNTNEGKKHEIHLDEKREVPQESTYPTSEENELKAEPQLEAQNQETTFTMQPNFEGNVTDTKNKRNDTEEEKVPVSHSREKLVPEDEGKFKQEEATETEEANKKQILITNAESVPKNEAQDTLPSTASVSVDTVDEQELADTNTKEAQKHEIDLDEKKEVSEVFGQQESAYQTSEEKELKAEPQLEVHNQETVQTNQPNLQGNTPETINQSNNIEEEIVPVSYSGENVVTEDEGKFTPEEATETEEATKMLKTESESVKEDEAQKTLLSTVLVHDEAVEKSIHQEIHDEEELAETNAYDGRKPEIQLDEKQKVTEESTYQISEENELKAAPQSEDENQETIFTKQSNLEAKATDILNHQSNDTKEEKFPVPQSREILVPEDERKFKQEEETEIEGAITMQILKTESESVLEDEAKETLPYTASVSDKAIEKSIHQELHDEEELVETNAKEGQKHEIHLDENKDVPEESTYQNSEENELKAAPQSEAQNQETILTNQPNLEAKARDIKNQSNDTQEQKVPVSQSREILVHEDEVKFKQEEATEIEEATKMQILTTESESVPDNKAFSTLSTIVSARDEPFEKSIQVEIHEETEFAIIHTREGQRPENELEENVKVLEAFDPHTVIGYTCPENEKKAAAQTEAQRMETMIIKHLNLEGMETAEISPINDTKQLEKEHKVAKPGGVSELLSVDITRECSNEEISNLSMLSDQNANNSTFDVNKISAHDYCKLDSEKEKKMFIAACGCTATSTHKNSESIEGQQDSEKTSEDNFTGVAKERVTTELETEKSSHEQKITDDTAAEKIVKAADTNGNLKLAPDSMDIEKSDKKNSVDATMYKADGTSTDDEKGEKVRNSLISNVAEKVEEKLDPDSQSGVHESTEMDKSELLVEKIPEPPYPCKKLESYVDSEAHNRTNDKHSQTKEKSNNILDQISESDGHIQGRKFQCEHQIKPKPQMEGKHHFSIPLNAKPFSMASLITEVHDGVERAGGSENIEEQTTDSEKSLSEVQILFPREETVNQVKDHDINNYKATESEQRVITDLSSENDPIKKETTSRDPDEVVEQASTGKPETQEAEITQEGSAKEEKGDEFEKISPSSSGGTAMIKGSRDTDMKASHKKSHGILSGVGSKVKHSISKVKKAITGKSSHPKTPSPK